jgi:hypothetical protein
MLLDSVRRASSFAASLNNKMKRALRCHFSLFLEVQFLWFPKLFRNIFNSISKYRKGVFFYFDKGKKKKDGRRARLIRRSVNAASTASLVCAGRIQSTPGANRTEIKIE